MLCGWLCVGTLEPEWGQRRFQWGPRRSEAPKRCPKGSPKRHLWEPNWREWPLAKTPAGPMFSSHSEGPGSSLFAPKIASGTRCALETFFFRLLCPLWAAKWGPRSAKWNPRSPQGSPKGPKGAPNPSPGLLKITKKPIRSPICKKERPGRLQGCPREGK